MDARAYAEALDPPRALDLVLKTLASKVVQWVLTEWMLVELKR